MTHSAIAVAINKQVPSVPKALAALAAMERELTATSTYEAIKRIIKEATAIKVLLGHVEEVKAKAEDTVLVASVRIGEEIKKVPKGNARRITQAGKSSPGRASTKLPGTSRA